jgi:predicted dithiol-disulfide oxidoreductase (DUF899 family)
MIQPRIASADEWLAARQELLIKEKALTRAQDALADERRRLPMVKVDKTYVFDTPTGPRTLAELFDGRSQLVIYHFMLGPEWSEGCVSCSFLADHIDGTLVHLAHRDVTLTVISRAPLQNIDAFKGRMGWKFPWVSAFGNDFNRDFHVTFTDEETTNGTAYYNFQAQQHMLDEMPGLSVFYKDEAGDIFHTYSTFGRGGEAVMTTYQFLDLVPKGRDEDRLAFTMSWVRHHDRYGADYVLDPTQPYQVPAKVPGGCCGTQASAPAASH